MKILMRSVGVLVPIFEAYEKNVVYENILVSYNLFLDW